MAPRRAEDRSLHSTFGSSKLVRQLAHWAPVEGEASGPDVAERLSAWFGPLDAIRLQAVQQALGVVGNGSGAAAGPEGRRSGMKAGAPPPQPSPRGGGSQQPTQSLSEDVQRTRGVLAQAIARDPLELAGLRPTDTEDPGYGPWQQRHIELQRQMGQMVGALRDHARQSIARVSPALRQLATLDAEFEQLLDIRQDTLLPTTVTLLERRYHQLRSAHRQACEAAGLPDDPACWREAGGWLAAFAHDWRQALLAELDLRLEPVMGLAEALRHEPDTTT
jgi:hypothetical protein